jgi:serine-type D-Ala-D-Ala carboxypeptidase/endopeptidase
MKGRRWKVHYLLLALLLALVASACSDDDPPVNADAGADAAPVGDVGGDGLQPDTLSPGKHQKQVDDLVRPIIQGKWAPGLVVGLISADGQEVYGYGETKIGGGVKPDQDTLFEIGSITKTFTSLALAGMVADGKLKLDDEVKALLPAGQVTVPSRSGKEITLLQLSTHSSGLPRMPDNKAPKDPKDPFADYDTAKLYAFLSGYTLTRDPGAQWEYSNLGVGLLGHALSLKANKSYEALVADRITGPLKLKDTAITLSSEQTKRLTPGYDWDLELALPIDLSVLAPAGALRSSARDMLAYLAAQTGITSTALTATLAETHKSHYKAATREMGLAWIITDSRYHWHNGGTGGFETFVGFDKQAKVGVVVLGNAHTGYSPQTKLGLALLKMLTQQSYQPVGLPIAISVPTATLDLYAGTYANANGFSVTVTRKGDALYVTWKDQPDYRMYAQTSESFYLRAAVIGITFIKDSTGAYSALTFASSSGKTKLLRQP